MSLPNELLPVGLLGTGAVDVYQIERSLRFNSADSAYLSRTPASAGNRKTWTWAGWVKRGRASTGTEWFYIFDSVTTNPSTGENFIRINGNHAGHTLHFRQDALSGAEIVTTQVFRDHSAWFHLVAVCDTTQGTASERMQLYVNGSRIITFSSATYPSQNADGAINNTTVHSIGRTAQSGRYWDGYLAEIHFIDGQALDPTSFGKFDTNGVWQPIEYSGTYGTNGFHLPFSDNSTAAALGTDTSGNGNDWTPNNFSVFDGIVSVSSATGGLPIHNTTDTYGAVQGSGQRTDSNASSLLLCIPAGTASGLDLVDYAISGRSSSTLTVTNNGTLSTTSTSKFYSGSADFSGTYTQWASVSNGDGRFNLASRTYTTIEFWYRCDSSSGNKGVLATGAYDNSGWEIYVEANGGCTMVVWNGTSGVVVRGTGAATLGEWHHCAFEVDYQTNKYIYSYLDGVYTGGSFNNLAFPNGKTTLNIGRRNGWTVDDSGTLYLQDIRVYSVRKYNGSNFSVVRDTPDPSVSAGIDSLVDTPTNGSQTDTGVGGEVVGNYCTLNPNDCQSSVALANGNLDASSSGLGENRVRGTIDIPTTGSWYFEVTIGASTQGWIGIGSREVALSGGSAVKSYGYNESGSYYIDGSFTSSVFATFTTGDVIGVKVTDNTSLAFYKNGTQTSTTKTIDSNYIYFPILNQYNMAVSVNFGQRPWAYPANASGAKALCTANLPEGSITTSGTFTGNSSTDGPFVYLNGVPTAMTINGNAVTFGTHADKLSNGFKVRNSTSSYNASGSNTYSISSTGAKFKVARAQVNP